MMTQDILRSVIDRIQATANVKTIFGEPVETKGKTIIPVARIAYGFGAGSGGREARPGDAQGETGSGSGGGGAAAMPVGVIEITDRETRFVPIGGTRKLFCAMMFGLMLGLFFAGRKSRR